MKVEIVIRQSNIIYPNRDIKCLRYAYLGLSIELVQCEIILPYKNGLIKISSYLQNKEMKVYSLVFS